MPSKLVIYTSGPDAERQEERIGRWAARHDAVTVASFSDPDRPGNGLIEAVRTATLRSAAIVVTAYDRLSAEPVHVALLTAVVRVIVAT